MVLNSLRKLEGNLSRFESVTTSLVVGSLVLIFTNFDVVLPSGQNMEVISFSFAFS
jgi:hypothetical protein